MNQEQVKSAIRTLISTFGGIVAGWFAAKGWFTIDQVTSILNNETVISLIASAVVFVWGYFTHTDKNAVAVVDAMAKNPVSPVKAVVTEPTVAGRKLAEAMPGATTVVAGTQAAVTLAKAA